MTAKEKKVEVENKTEKDKNLKTRRKFISMNQKEMKKEESR